jgi:adenylate kinase family enzyme
MNKITKLNNIINNFFGLRIARYDKNEIPLELEKYEKDRPLIVEFVGLSGIGKSTLFSQIDWKKNKCVPINNFYEQKKDSDNLIFQAKEYQTLASIMTDRISNIPVPPTEYFLYFCISRKLLMEDFTVQNFNINHIIVSDEGIIHNFGDDLIKLKELDSSLFQKLMLNRKVVFCDTTSDVLAERVLKRKKEIGRISAIDRNLTKDELILKFKNELEQKRNFIAWLEDQGIDCLKIDMNNQMHLNVLTIEEYIKK